MPVPRLFEGPIDQRERWIHPLACLIGLTGPGTKPALLTELVGEDLPGAMEALTREAQPLEGAGADILVRDRDQKWALVIQATLGFDADVQAGIAAAHAALAGKVERVIGVVITPDRKPPAGVTAATASGLDVRHKSWLRVRDWIQERPERGNAQGVDLALLREADYFYTPRVAELYRLEELMPTIAQPIRPTLAGIYFDLNDIHIAPLFASPATGVSQTRIAFPRTGDAQAEITLADGALGVRVAEANVGGAATDGGWSSVAIADPTDWTRARSAVLAAARRLLPPPR